MDLIVSAFNQMSEKELIIIGDGPDFNSVRKMANPNIKLLGYQPLEVLRDYMGKAKAFVFAAEEDFGIVPVEAQACGTPVIGFGKGGLMETVVDNETGIFFNEQTVNSIKAAIARFELVQDKFDPILIRKHSERFSKERFKREFMEYLTSLISIKKESAI